MSTTPSIEDRIVALIAVYADRAPLDVDPIAVARQAAARPARPIRHGQAFGPTDRRLALAFVAMSVLLSVAAGALLAGGHPFEREPSDLLPARQLVEPFAGLPPVGATPSMPETGDLTVGFFGRFPNMRWHGSWLLADGRLISTQDWHRGILVEQLLTPSGVDLVRTLVEASSTGIAPGASLVDVDRFAHHTPGLAVGDIAVRLDGRLVYITWADPDLPRLLGDPESWLPALAWRDARVSGYVPSHYRVCVEPAADLGGLPGQARDLLVTRGVPRPEDESGFGCRFDVTLADARALVTSLIQAGLPLPQQPPFLRFHLPSMLGQLPGWIELLPVVPDGSAHCNCG